MQIVIDIPKGFYEHVKGHKDIFTYGLVNGEKIGEIIANGTVLPDNHGRIIDGDIVLGWLIFNGAINNIECGEVAEVFKMATLLERTVKE